MLLFESCSVCRGDECKWGRGDSASLVQVAMYKLVAKQGLAGLSLQATSGGLCSLQGFVEDVVPWSDDAWGRAPSIRITTLGITLMNALAQPRLLHRCRPVSCRTCMCSQQMA